jgi:poly-gamma-glutamate capsule biosynthesis protein CapA/YwtB (metallophosphatase superfamily)
MKIGLIGNINLGEKANYTINSYNKFGLTKKTLYSLWGNTLDNLHSHDILSGNLNSILTDNLKYNENYSHLNKNFARCLIPTKINHLSISNKNMIKGSFNYNYGLNDTVKTLEKMGIGYSGANMIKGFESEPHFITTNGYIVGFLSATHNWINELNELNELNESDESNESNESNEYNFKNKNNYIWKLSTDKNMDKGDKINHCNAIRLIQNTKKMCDILIITLNWGDNFTDYVSNIIINLCRLMIDNGADIIQCTGTNNILPIEMYNGGFIFYSLGNFINGDVYSYNDSDKYIKYQTDLGAIATIEYPTKIEESYINNSNVGILNITPTISMIQYGVNSDKINVKIALDEDKKFIVSKMFKCVNVY